MRAGITSVVATALATALLTPTRSFAAEPDEEPTPVAFRRVTVSVNPLAALIERYGFNVEILPARHHAIVATPYIATFSCGWLCEDGAFRLASGAGGAFGSEVGYRYYAGDRGANGLFVGPSALVQWNRAGTVYGAILDAGAQHVARSGLTIGGGGGVAYLTAPSSPRSAGFVPRVLFTLGFSF